MSRIQLVAQLFDQQIQQSNSKTSPTRIKKQQFQLQHQEYLNSNKQLYQNFLRQQKELANTTIDFKQYSQIQSNQPYVITSQVQQGNQVNDTFIEVAQLLMSQIQTLLQNFHNYYQEETGYIYNIDQNAQNVFLNYQELLKEHQMFKEQTRQLFDKMLQHQYQSVKGNPRENNQLFQSQHSQMEYQNNQLQQQEEVINNYKLQNNDLNMQIVQLKQNINIINQEKVDQKIQIAQLEKQAADKENTTNQLKDYINQLNDQLKSDVDQNQQQNGNIYEIVVQQQIQLVKNIGKQINFQFDLNQCTQNPEQQLSSVSKQLIKQIKKLVNDVEQYKSVIAKDVVLPLQNIHRIQINQLEEQVNIRLQDLNFRLDQYVLNNQKAQTTLFNYKQANNQLAKQLSSERSVHIQHQIDSQYSDQEINRIHNQEMVDNNDLFKTVLKLNQSNVNNKIIIDQLQSNVINQKSIQEKLDNEKFQLQMITNQNELDIKINQYQLKNKDEVIVSQQQQIHQTKQDNNQLIISTDQLQNSTYSQQFQQLSKINQSQSQLNQNSLNLSGHQFDHSQLQERYGKSVIYDDQKLDSLLQNMNQLDIELQQLQK